MNNTRIIERSSLDILKILLHSCPNIDTNISEHDKIPAIDGHISLFKKHSTDFSTENMIGTINIQVKGSTSLVINKESFKISASDLNFYMKNGGCILFVIDVNRSIVFYKMLLPIYINHLISSKKKKQKSYSVKLDLFPQDEKLIYKKLYSFYKESKFQYSSDGIGRSIANLKNIDGYIFSSFSFAKNKESLIIDTPLIQPYYKSSSGHIEPLSMIKLESLSMDIDLNLSFKGCKNILTVPCQYFITENVNCNYLLVNKQIKFYTKNNTSYFTYNLNNSTINETLLTLEILHNMYLGKIAYLNNEEFFKLNEDKEQLKNIAFLKSIYNSAKNLGETLNINLNEFNFTYDDIHALANIFLRFESKKIYCDTIPKVSPVLINIGPIKIALLVEQNVTQPYYFNLFDSKLKYGEKKCNRIPTYMLVNHEFLINSINVSLNQISADINSIKVSTDPEQLHLLTSFSCELMLAYLETKNVTYLTLANILCEKILNKHNSDIHMLNLLLTKYLSQTLSLEDKKILHSIYDQNNEEKIKWGAAILSDAFNEAEKHFDSISKDEIDNIKRSPLYKVYESKLSNKF